MMEQNKKTLKELLQTVLKKDFIIKHKLAAILIIYCFYQFGYRIGTFLAHLGM